MSPAPAPLRTPRRPAPAPHPVSVAYPNPNGTINHSTVIITLLSRAGRIELRIDGLAQSKAALAARLRAIAAQKAP